LFQLIIKSKIKQKEIRNNIIMFNWARKLNFIIYTFNDGIFSIWNVSAVGTRRLDIANCIVGLHSSFGVSFSCFFLCYSFNIFLKHMGSTFYNSVHANLPPTKINPKFKANLLSWVDVCIYQHAPYSFESTFCRIYTVFYCLFDKRKTFPSLQNSEVS